MVMKGRPLAKAGYEQELSSIRGFIAMQNKADSAGGTVVPTAADKVGSIKNMCMGYRTSCMLAGGLYLVLSLYSCFDGLY